MAGNSPFDPTGEFAEMKLLSPSAKAYRKHSLFTIFVGSMIVTGFLITVLVLGWQHRLAEELQFAQPIPTILLYIVSSLLLRWMVTNFRPVIIFFNPADETFNIVENKIFGYSKIVIEVSNLEEVDINEKFKKWEVGLKFNDGRQFIVPRADIYEARQSAIRIGREAEIKISGEDADGESIRDSITDVPLYKRLTKSDPPKVDIKLLIDKTKSKGKIRWDINLPVWISYIILVFALLNVGAGVYIWMRLDENIARWASIPFIMTTFVVFVIAAIMKGFKRPIDMDITGIEHRKMHIPLEELENIDIKKGLVISRLHLISPSENFFLLTTTKQANWLKADIEYEIWIRRGEIAQRD